VVLGLALAGWNLDLSLELGIIFCRDIETKANRSRRLISASFDLYNAS
jgi:hypothetical protein